MSSFLTRAIVLIVLCLMAGCATAETVSQDEAIAFTLAEQVSLAIGPVSVPIAVTRDGQPLPGATVTLTGDMTHAGMRPVVGTAISDDAGIARVPLEWTMGGDWIISVHITGPAGGIRTGRFELIIAGPTPAP